MYITFNKETKRVVYIGEKKPIAISDNLTLAEVETIPDKYDYLTVVNEREKTNTWTEIQEEYNEETQEVVEKEVEKSRTYFTCDLKACFKPAPTNEELEKLKQVRYEKLVERLIRQKYTLSNEIAILRQASAKPEEFNEYNTYAEECKAVAKTEIYGG